MAEFVPAAPPDFSTWRLPHPLYDFQEEAVREALLEKHGTIKLATGAGKTATGIGVIIATKLPTVVLVPTKILLEQWVRDLAAAGIRAGVWFGEAKRPGFVTVTTYQSLFTNPELIRSFPVVLMDEGDLTTGDVWSRILTESRQHEYAIILTATLPTDPQRESQLLANFPILIERTPGQMIAAGRFVPVRVEPRPVRLSFETRQEYDRVTERMNRLRGILHTGNPQQVAQLANSGDPQTRQAAGAYLRLVSMRRDLLARVPERSQTLLDLVRQHPGVRILVFGTLVDVVSDACAYVTMSGSQCRVISGDTVPRERTFILDEWGKSFFVLGSVDVLTRGFNVPEASVAVIMGGGNGERRLIQRIGRVVRASPGKEGATVYVVYAQDTSESDLPATVRRLFAEAKGTGDVGE